MKLKIETIGDEIGVILPEDLVSRLNLDQGGSFLTAEPVGGGIHLVPRDPASDRMRAGDGGRDK